MITVTGLPWFFGGIIATLSVGHADADFLCQRPSSLRGLPLPLLPPILTTSGIST
jgi:hypothetical protein